MESTQSPAPAKESNPDCSIFLCGLPSTLRSVRDFETWERDTPDPRIETLRVELPHYRNRKARIVRYRHHQHENDEITPSYVQHSLGLWEHPTALLFVYNPGTYLEYAMEQLKQAIHLYKTWQGCRGFWIVIADRPGDNLSSTSVVLFREALAKCDDLKEIIEPSGGLKKAVLHMRGVLDACYLVAATMLRDARAFLPEKLDMEELTRAMSGQEFRESFLAGNIPVWRHENYLRAAYVTLLEPRNKERSLLDVATDFATKLRNARRRHCRYPMKPEHRTLTVFWLYHLRLAIEVIEQFEGQHQLLDRFDSVFRYIPDLANRWMPLNYFGRDLLESEQAAMFWMLPDLRDLSGQDPRCISDKGIDTRPKESERLLHFAFCVVQRYLLPGEKRRRSWFVEQAFVALQRQTTRLRAILPNIAPFSETQAYFYLQLVHASLAHLITERNRDAIREMTYALYRRIANISPSVWTDHYSPEVWNGVPARAHFVPPDLKPLPDALEPVVSWIQPGVELDAANARLRARGLVPEIPPVEAQLFYQSVLLDDAKARNPPIPTSPAQVTSHAHLLRYVHANLAGPLYTSPSESDIQAVCQELLDKLTSPTKSTATVMTVALHLSLRGLRERRDAERWASFGGHKIRSEKTAEKGAASWEAFEEWVRSDWGGVLCWEDWWRVNNQGTIKVMFDVWVHPELDLNHQISNYSTMRLNTALALIVGLTPSVLGAATKWYSDVNCKKEIGKRVFNGLAEGDAIIPPEAVAIKVDAWWSSWWGYNETNGKECKGSQTGEVKRDKCIKLTALDDTDPERDPRIVLRTSSAAMAAEDVQVKLRVGDRIFTTMKSSLTGESDFFAALLSGRWNNTLEDGSYFIDADPNMFEHILNYLRRGVFPLFYDEAKGFDYARYVSLLAEARYFQIRRLENWINNKGFLDAVQVVHTSQVYDDTPPADVTPANTTITHNVTWVKKKVYICPRGIEVHRGQPEKCGRRCNNARNGVDDYVEEVHPRFVVANKVVLFQPSKCMGPEPGAMGGN
ncbi:hypothetical protein VTJ49DRAFT_7035 [Mycothermus thermophilus]|uniref:BTB domain-containing protein n=1 Tax=Humicola insolens TaxID=85995 RepID=A0ABR3VJC2_HUMIN